MAQLIIDTGAAPNDGTGDPLRTAFTETNNNFTAIWTAGPVDSNVRIVNNTILTLNTNGNLVLAPNGVGKVVANVDIVPNSSNIRNLGSSSNRWNTVYSQYLNVDNTVSIAGDVVIGGNLTVTGDSIELGNIITDALTIQLGNTASTELAANGAGVTVGSNDDIATILYNAAGNVWTTNIGISAVGNITAPYFIGNGSQLTGLPDTYANANVVSYAEVGWAGNIIPSADNTYSLGNATNQWSELHVANATIYIGGVALGVTGNTLTVDGEAVLSNDSASSITTTGNITAGNLSANDISVSGDIVMTNGKINTSRIRSRTDQGQDLWLEGETVVTIRTDEGGSDYDWTFRNDSTLRLPNGAIIKDVDNSMTFGAGAGETSQGHSAVAIGEGAGKTQQGIQAIAVGRGSGNHQQGIGAVGIGFCAGATSQGDYAVAIGFKAARGNMDDDGTPNQPANSIMINASSTPLNGDQAGLYINPVREDVANVAKAVYYNATTKELTYADPTGSGDSLISDNSNIAVTIENATTPGNTLTWTFDTDGFVNLPNGGVVGDIFDEGMIGIQANPNDSNSYASLVSGDKQQAVDASNNEVIIWTDDAAQGGSLTNQWKFNRAGAMTFPDSSVQTTAYTGTVPAANVTGLATVATSGSYNDLSSQPTIPTLGNFSLTDNTIQTGNGVGGITLSIFGPDQGVPDPAFISREWTFGNTGAFTSPGNVSGTNFIASGTVTATGNLAAGNISTAILTTSGALTVNSSASIGAQLTAYSMVVNNTTTLTGNTSAGNIAATGNIDANYMNITHDISANYIDAVANIAAGNVIVLDTFWGGAVSVTGNVNGGNVNATGNVTATSFIGNGSQLTGLATVATSGAYSDLSGAPTTVSSFTNDANYVASNITGITGADQVTNMVSLTQAEYDAITPNASTVYFIVG